MKKRYFSYDDIFDIPDKYKIMMQRARKVFAPEYKDAYPNYTFLLRRRTDESIDELRTECEDLVEYAESMYSMAKIFECPAKMDNDSALMMVSDSRMRFLEKYMPSECTKK